MVDNAEKLKQIDRGLRYLVLGLLFGIWMVGLLPYLLIPVFEHHYTELFGDMPLPKITVLVLGGDAALFAVSGLVPLLGGVFVMVVRDLKTGLGISGAVIATQALMYTIVLVAMSMPYFFLLPMAPMSP